MTASSLDPHAGQPVRRLGPEPAAARLVAIMVHGRGAAAEDMLALAGELRTTDVAYLAPQAAGNSWYPYSFLTPMDENEPWLTSALRLVQHLVESLDRQGIASGRVAIMGFSQGACLALEFAARNPHRYAAIAGLSGGLIGPPGTPRSYPGSLDGTPVFLGCSDVDSHIPLERVHETADVLRRLGASVDERIYPGMGHTVNLDEIKAVRKLLNSTD
ncbi:MAG TPA: dienelactone hydrolase family protein [Vicinamibacterales bacterium]|nr:dienelactone hydrolase family protein [Vicinamibacterales bacterium]